MNLSRRATIAWSCLLLISNLLLFAWLFRVVSPFQYLTEIYFSKKETPFVYGLPAAMLALCALIAYIKIRKPEIISRIVLRPSVRWIPLCAMIVSAVAFVILFNFSQFENFLSALLGLLLVGQAAVMGDWILSLRIFSLNSLTFDSHAEHFVLSSATGMGVLSLVVFAAGSIKVIPFGIVFLIALLLAMALSERWRKAMLARAWPRLVALPAEKSAFAVGAISFVALLLLTHLPLLWAAPSDYDVLEYHLAAPAQYLQQGRISFLHENIYSNFPENGEMLYLFAMQISGNRFNALPCAHAILLSAWILSIIGVYGLAKRLVKSIPVWGEEAADSAPAVAALLYALIPLGAQLAADFYVEHFQALFHICALLCACAFLKEMNLRAFFPAGGGDQNMAAKERARPGWLLAAGMFAGLACGTKYTALLFTLAPLLIFIPLICLQLGSARDAFGALCRIALPALIFFAPWALRNFLEGGDPLYPLGLVMQRRIAGASGVPDKLDHFEAAHRAGEKSWSAFVQTLRQLMPGLRAAPHLDEIECGPQLLCFAAPGVACISSPETAFIACVFAADLALWFFFSHRLNRFFYPQLSALAALGGLGVAGVWRIRPLRKVCVALLAACVLLFAPVQLLWTWLYSSREAPGRGVLAEAAQQFGNFNAAQSFEGVRAMAALKPGSRVLFIGEARTFYCDQTPLYSVVFNVSPLEKMLRESKSADDLRARMKAAGVTHLYFNYAEWTRLDTTYALVGEAGRAQWKLAQWTPAQSRLMTELLRTGNFVEYAALFPENTFAAYLKLNAEQYVLFEKFLAEHTQRVWPAQDAQFGVCELREIK